MILQLNNNINLGNKNTGENELMCIYCRKMRTVRVLNVVTYVPVFLLETL